MRRIDPLSGVLGFERIYNSAHMFLDPDFAPNLNNLAVWTDQESRAFDAHISFPIVLFLDPNAVILANLTGFVAAQCDVQRVFGREFFMFGDCVA